MNLLMEHDERPQQAPANSIEDVKNVIASEVLNTIKAQVSSSEERGLFRGSRLSWVVDAKSRGGVIEMQKAKVK